MTESEWFACTDPAPMLEFVRGKVSDRKIRLFCIACCRHIWHLLDNEGSRAALLVAERFADGEASNQQRRAAFGATDLPASGALYIDIWEAVHMVRLHIGYTIVQPRLVDTEEGHQWVTETEPGDATQAGVLREVLGPLPFHSLEFDPAWRTSATLALARQMYASSDFTLTSILADAFQDAGCDDHEILNHLRRPGVHFRGCWVLDAILGKE